MNRNSVSTVFRHHFIHGQCRHSSCFEAFHTTMYLIHDLLIPFPGQRPRIFFPKIVNSTHPISILAFCMGNCQNFNTVFRNFICNDIWKRIYETGIYAIFIAMKQFRHIRYQGNTLPDRFRKFYTQPRLLLIVPRYSRAKFSFSFGNNMNEYHINSAKTSLMGRDPIKPEPRACARRFASSLISFSQEGSPPCT